MSVADDIASARALLERAERETNPESKAHALDEALSLLASCDPDDATDAEAKLIANLRLAHTRRLLTQLAGFTSISTDAWFSYAVLIVEELRPEVQRLMQSEPEFKETYDRLLKSWGPGIEEVLRRPG